MVTSGRQSRINSMRCRRSVRANPHHVRLSQASFVATGNKRYARRMKTQMWQTDSLKEFPPRLGSAAFGQVRMLECIFSPALSQAAKQVPEVWRERAFGYAFFLTFRAESEHVTGEIHVTQSNQCFGKTTALFPGDFIRNAHPFRFHLQRLGDEAVFRFGDARLALWLVTADADPVTGICLREPRSDRFVYDEAQELYFEQRGVFNGYACASFSARLFSPLDEIAYLLPCQLPRDRNADGIEISREIPPGLCGA